MCWYNDKLKIKTAKKDISVWKIVKLSTSRSPDKCYSLYAEFPYVKAIIETTSIEFNVMEHGLTIKGNKGFHSYSNKLKWEKRNDILIVLREKTLFKSCNYVTGVPINSDIRIAKFHIPKGYKYAINKDGEIISSAIVFDRFIE